MPTPPVELHVVSDATGETAARLVQALEAQFPDQEFVEIRHPRVESEQDLQLAVNRMRGRAAVVVYTLVQPQLRETMRTLCRRARLRAMGAPGRNRQYAELAEIYEELEEAKKLHRRLKCPVIDISELSIEETAHRVLRVIEERRMENAATK